MLEVGRKVISGEKEIKFGFLPAGQEDMGSVGRIELLAVSPTDQSGEPWRRGSFYNTTGSGWSGYHRLTQGDG
jgi:hypothetical protein